MNTAEKYVGKIIDRRYQINRIIGIGGMAVVYEATDVVLNRTVAFKMLKDEMSDDEEAVKRFINESKAVSMLSHPNIVKIFDVSVKSRLKYIVMERIEGITLKSHMQKKGALSADEVLSYSEQVLKALEHAHSKGIVHRDIKPQNILLLKNGKVKVTDFGIAVLPTSEQTPNGKAIGTVYYISPEQANGKETDTRSDLYSLGVLMYEMSTGVLPFNADTPVSVALMQIKDKPKPPSEVKCDISYGLEQIILGAMEKSPERRFQSATQMLKYLERIRLNPDYIFKTCDGSAKEQNTAIMKKTANKHEKKSSNNRRQSKSMFPIILGVSIAFAIVLIISAVSILDMVMKNENRNAPETVIVPDIVGKVIEDGNAANLLDPAIFTYTIKYKYSEEPAGTIIEQDPVGNSQRRIQRGLTYYPVVLLVSRGTELVSIPDFSGIEFRTARMQAEDLGFIVKFVNTPSESYGVGKVIKSEPEAMEKLAYGSTITLYISDGMEYEMVKAENYTNLTPAQAYEKYKGSFILGEVTYEYSDTIEKGKIVSQSLIAGTQYIKNTKIDFILSLGKNPAESSDTVTQAQPNIPDQTSENDQTN